MKALALLFVMALGGGVLGYSESFVQQDPRQRKPSREEESPWP